MSKLTKEEKAKVKGFIKFEDGVISNQETLEEDLIQFCNDKYITKYKEKKDYQHIKPMQNFINSDGTATDHTVPEDNSILERVSVLVYQESIKDRRSRGINVKGEPKTISPIAREDVGIKRQYLPYYQLNSEKVYLTFESINNYSEESKTQWACEQVYAKAYSEKEKTIDNAINSIFDKYRDSDNKNEILFLLLVNLNKEQLDYFSHEALSFFLQQELKNYHVLPNQKKILDRIILAGENPDANQKKLLKRLFKISKKK